MSASFNPAASFAQPPYSQTPDPAAAAAPQAPGGFAPAPAGPAPMFGCKADTVQFGNAEAATPDDDGEKAEKGPVGRILEGLKEHFSGIGKNPFKLLAKLVTFPFKLPVILFQAVKSEVAKDKEAPESAEAPAESTDS